MTKVPRRNLPGTKRDDIGNWPILYITDLEGAFAQQEYIQMHIAKDMTNLDKICKLPERQDKAVWVFEHIRQFLIELNALVVFLTPVCTIDTCPKMSASKWEFLCAAHRQPKECCAIDYITHTLNGFTALINNSDTFPSRIRIPKSSCKYFGSIVRRLYRLFAHTYFHHRRIFDDFENQTYLCSRFVKFVSIFKLMARKSLIIPISDLNL
uniref:MOB-like protein phocein isoform X1 n=1 Tax=Hirondellea gigas TaxID=1518452 RepID=A0A6A7GCA3_9CRUS